MGIGKIKGYLISLDLEKHLYLHEIIAQTIIIHKILKRISAIRNGFDGLSRDSLRIVQKAYGIEIDHFQAIFFNEFFDPPDTRYIGHNLGGKISLSLNGCSHIVQKKLHQLLIYFTPLIDLHGRNDDSLLKDGRSQGHGSGCHAAHIGVMGTICHIEERIFIACKYGSHDGDIG